MAWPLALLCFYLLLYKLGMNSLSKYIEEGYRTMKRTLSICIAVSLISGCGPSIYKQSLSNARHLSIVRAKDMALSTQTFTKSHGKKRAIQASLDSVKEIMKDPDSVKFKDVEYKNYNDGKIVCGQVNAKNSYGGYTGFKRFIASPIDAYVYNDDQRQDNRTRNSSNAGIYEACGALTF